VFSKFVKTGVYKSMFRLRFLFYYFNVSDLSKLGAEIDVLKATGMCERRIKQADGTALGVAGQHILM